MLTSAPTAPPLSSTQIRARKLWDAHPTEDGACQAPLLPFWGAKGGRNPHDGERRRRHMGAFPGRQPQFRPQSSSSRHDRVDMGLARHSG